ncbi:hypothetical protein [Streptosporangium roseum]|uniref:hypothetical protein n=1 Tax=Streptosporangium roseum TaxID=2001 RepID=UPI0004CD236E|nr:hypothetical protein [Streptosporangium roseum]
MANLWPVDCQTCGRPLRDKPPALLVDDMIAFGIAALHHPACQASDWNDGTAHVSARGHLVSRRARVVLPPFLRNRTPEPRPMLLINPGLETVMLELDDQQRWRAAVHQSFFDIGLRPPGNELVIDRPLPDIIGQVTSDALAVRFKTLGPSEHYAPPSSCIAAGPASSAGSWWASPTPSTRTPSPPRTWTRS